MQSSVSRTHDTATSSQTHERTRICSKTPTLDFLAILQTRIKDYGILNLVGKVLVWESFCVREKMNLLQRETLSLFCVICTSLSIIEKEKKKNFSFSFNEWKWSGWRGVLSLPSTTSQITPNGVISLLKKII